MRICAAFSSANVKGGASRLWRKSKGHLTLRRIYYSVEFLLFAIIYFPCFLRQQAAVYR